MLTFVGIRPVQEPYQVIGQIRSLVYFRYYPIHRLLERGWDLVMTHLQFRFRKGEEVTCSQGGYDGGGELR